MSNPSMVIRIAANLAELKANLAESSQVIHTTTAGMQKLATSFAGDRLIQQAHNVAAAVHQIGGASKLTDAEQARVNRTVEAALAKYVALGREAPQALQRLAEETRQAEQPLISMSGILQGMVAGATAAVTARLMNAGSALMAFGREALARGDEIARLAPSFERLAGGAEQADSMLQHLRRGTSGLVDDMALMQSGNRAMLLGLNLSSEEMGRLAQTATVLGRAMGQDATKSLDDLIVALGRTSPMILDNLGLTVKVGEANAAYAEKLGKTVRDLTDAEKKQAFMTAAMSAAAVKVAELGEVKLTASEHASKLWTSFRNLTDAGANLAVSNGLVDISLRQLSDGMSTLEQVIRNGPVAAWREYHGLNDVVLPQIADTAGAGWLAADALTGVALSTDALTKAMAGTSKELADVNKRVAELDKTSEQLFGQAHIDRARLMVDVLGHTSNITKLTDSAKRDLVATVQRAVEVYRALGQQAPASMQRILDATRENLTTTQSFTAQFPRLQAAVGDAGASLHTLWTQSLQDTGKAQREVEQFAHSWGAVLAPSVQSAMRASDRETQGFFAKVFGGSQDLAANVSGIFQAAFVGGGGALGAVKAFATETLSTLMGMIPGLPPWVTAFAGPIVEMLSKLGGKVKDFFSGLFGGPSRDELNGRNLVAEFEQNLAGMLTAQQQAEAGGEAWKQTVIALRDAYLAAGRTADEAMRDAERLWASSRSGAEASRRVIEEINTKLHGVGEAAREVEDAARTAFDGMGGAGTAAAADVEAAMSRAASLSALAAQTGSEEAQIAAEIAIQEAERLADEVAQSLDATAQAGKHAMDVLKDAVLDMPRVVDIEFRGRYNGPTEPGYASGTMGRHGRWFADFGGATATVLHGREAVVREDQAISFARDVLGGHSDPELKQMLRDLPRAMKIAMREAMAGA